MALLFNDLKDLNTRLMEICRMFSVGQIIMGIH